MSVLKESYSLSHYEKNSWVLESRGMHYIISAPAKELLELLKESESLSQACDAFNNRYGYQFSESQFWEFIINRLGFTGLIAGFEPEVEKEHKFINLQFVIFKPALAARLGRPLQPLFNQSFFYITFSLLLILAIYSLFTVSFQSLGFSVFALMALYLVTIILHELGHIAACRKFTGKNGEIGGGLYLIFPVLFSNITALWQAGKSERVIGNLAGVYLQLWCLLFLFLLHQFYPDVVLFNQIVFMLSLYSLIQLIPFIRSDGYWLLSDLSNTPNLLSKANESLRDFLKSPLAYFTKDKRPKATFLLLYSVFNNALILYFITLQLLRNRHALLHFPEYLLDVLKHLIQLEPVAFDFSYFPVILFYIVSFQMLKRIFDSVFTSKKQQQSAIVK